MVGLFVVRYFDTCVMPMVLSSADANALAMGSAINAAGWWYASEPRRPVRAHPTAHYAQASHRPQLRHN